MRCARPLNCLLLSALVASPLGAVARQMFVTSVTGTGNLSTWADAGGFTGLDAGDAICQARAARRRACPMRPAIAPGSRTPSTTPTAGCTTSVASGPPTAAS